MKRFKLLLVHVAFVALCNAQSNISGVVLSFENDQPVSDVQIFSENDQFLGKTGSNGEFSVMLSKNQRISFRHMLYLDYYVEVESASDDVKIFLESREILLSDVYVSAKLPEVVYSDPSFHVADYQFGVDGIFILAYTKSRMLRKALDAGKTILSDCQVILLDDQLNVKSQTVFFKDGVSLYLDSYGQLFLKCLNKVYFIYEEGENLLSVEIDQQEFSETIEPMIYGDADLRIYSNYDKTFPEFSYYAKVGNEEESHVIYTVTDSILLHTFRAQYRNLGPRDKLNAYRTELKTGIDKEIISGYMTGFHNDILFHPPYAPVFKTDSGLLIIDVTNSEMQYFDDQGDFQSSSPFFLHEKPRRTGWKNQIIQDLETNELYLVYEKNGKGEVELLVNGENHSELNMKLFYKYPQTVKIKDGYVYYLYRPFESSQKHYLYKEEIRLSSNSSKQIPSDENNARDSETEVNALRK